MHTIDLSKFNYRTDLIIEQEAENFLEFKHEEEDDDIIVDRVVADEKKRKNYITISFLDITDKDNYMRVQNVFIEEFKKILGNYDLKKKKIMVIGLGNSSSTPDALGPLVIDNILVTRHLFELGDVEEGYKNVCAFAPGVTGTTGIETGEYILGLVQKLEVDFVIVIDALAASSLERLNKTIQITDNGINPGSGVGNDRGVLNEEVLGVPVIAIGVPTVVDAISIVNDTLSYALEENKDNLDEDINEILDTVIRSLDNNFIVTPKEIDFLVEKFSSLIGNGINKSLHEAFNSTQ